jgi:hypothetical protein
LLILYSTRICPYHAACSARTKRVLGIALEKTRVCLGLADDFDRGIITKRIVELAKAGERNPDLLCEGALKKLREIIQVAPTRRCRATGRGWPPPPFLEGSVQGNPLNQHPVSAPHSESACRIQKLRHDNRVQPTIVLGLAKRPGREPGRVPASWAGRTGGFAFGRPKNKRRPHAWLFVSPSRGQTEPEHSGSSSQRPLG